MAAKPSTAAIEVDPRLCSHHSRRDPATEPCGDDANDGTRKEMPTGGMQTKVENRGRIKGDGKNGSEGDVPPAKTPKTVKAM